MNKYVCTYQIGDKVKKVTLYAKDEREAAICSKYRISDMYRGCNCTVKRA